MFLCSDPQQGNPLEKEVAENAGNTDDIIATMIMGTTGADNTTVDGMPNIQYN